MSLGAAPNLAVETELAPHATPPLGALGAVAEERISVATQRQLMWWRFRTHRLSLLASAGVVGLAIGFGAQTLVKDMLNGFFILVENQYNVGDVIQVAGVGGTVEDMTLRRTVLRDADGTVHVVPNSEIKIVSNKTRDWARVLLHVAAAYDENSERVIQLLREVADDVRNDPNYAGMIVAEPEVPGIERVVGAEVDYLMQVKTLPGAPQYAVSRELRRRIKERFEKNNIKAAGPAKVYVFDPGQRGPGEENT